MFTEALERAASSASSRFSRALKGQPSNVETVAVLARIKRSGAQYQECLLDDPDLLECHRRMQEAGLPTELETGTRIYLEPEHVKPTLDCLETLGVNLGTKHLFKKDLRAWHIIAGSKYFETVKMAMGRLEPKLQVKVSQSQELRVEVPYPQNAAEAGGSDGSLDEHGPQRGQKYMLSVEIDSDGDDHREALVEVPLGSSGSIPGKRLKEASLGPTGSHLTQHGFKTVCGLLSVQVPTSLRSAVSDGKRTSSTTQRNEDAENVRSKVKRARLELPTAVTNFQQQLGRAAGQVSQDLLETQTSQVVTSSTQSHSSQSQSLGGLSQCFSDTLTFDALEDSPDVVVDYQ